MFCKLEKKFPPTVTRPNWRIEYEKNDNSKINLPSLISGTAASPFLFGEFPK